MQYLEQFLEDCSVAVLQAQLTHCWPDWAETNYTPEYNKLHFIQSGEGEFSINGAVYHPQPGEFLLMPAGTLQSYRSVNENCYVKYWCHFTAVSGGIRLFDALKTPLCVRASHPERVKAFYEELIEGTEHPSAFSQLRVKAALLELLAEFLTDAGENVGFSETLPVNKLTRLTGYISSHLKEEITLEELAAVVHFHPNYFISFFKKYFGTSPLKYVNEARLNQAKRLLKSTDESVAQIAEETGFRDLYHFSKRFKASTGYSPSDFRKL